MIRQSNGKEKEMAAAAWRIWRGEVTLAKIMAGEKRIWHGDSKFMANKRSAAAAISGSGRRQNWVAPL